MDKWYEKPEAESDIIISSRVRLARNVKKYPFRRKLTEVSARKLIEETVASVKSDSHAQMAARFDFLDMEKIADLDKQAMLEKHIISSQLISSGLPAGLLLEDDETVSIMLNEEDHIRIQTVLPGESMDKSYDMADGIDDLIEETVEYAFMKNFGYLTSCPTNAGTGLRASYMLHLPMLCKTDQLKNVLQAIVKFGITVRGVYGEGSESLGHIYQISNQVTLGKTEREIINGLKNVTTQVIERERWLTQRVLAEQSAEMEDNVYRAYGILSNCHKITAKEASSLLSEIRFGYVSGILKKPRPKLNTYNIMMNIQPGNLQKSSGKELDERSRDIYRADYLREMFSTNNEII